MRLVNYKSYFKGDDKLSYLLDVGSAATRALFIPFGKGKVLEVGSGINQIFPNSTTLDIAGSPDIKVAIDSFTGIPKGSFDTIIMSLVLEHVESDFRAIAECERLLKPGGLLVVLSPGHLSGICNMKEIELNGHLRCYSRERVALLEKPDFPCVYFIYVHFIHSLVWNRLKYVLKALNYPFRKIDDRSIYQRWWYAPLAKYITTLLNSLDRKFTRKPGNAFFVFKKLDQRYHE